MPDPISRTGVEVLRIVQAMFATIAILYPQIADSQSKVEALVSAGFGVAALLVEFWERHNVTPVADPKDDSGHTLVPADMPLH